MTGNPRICSSSWNRPRAHVRRETRGRMHTARSRNDIDITLYRMCLRLEILEIVRNLNAARRVLAASRGSTC